MAESRSGSKHGAEESLHRWAVALVVCTFLLVTAGGLVTSRDAGLAVPDWPLSFGTVNPPHWYAIENVRTEHGHRLIAGFVALLTAAVALRARRLEVRRSVRLVAYGALIAVLAQALLGGLRVLRLSVDLAMLHGWLAQMFLCLAVSLAVVTSSRWRESTREVAGPLPLIALGTTLVIVCQLGIGIMIRHAGTQARPLAANEMFYWHIAGALLTLVGTVAMASLCKREHIPDYLVARTRLLLGLVLSQILLGITTWTATETMTTDQSASFFQSWVPTLHVVVGAGVLATSVTIALHASARRAGRSAEQLHAHAAEAH